MTLLRNLSLVLVATASPLATACGSSCELGEQEALWKDLTAVADGSFSCFASSKPFDCKVGEKGCVPSLVALHAEGNVATHRDKVKAVLEAKGFKVDEARSKGFDDGSTALHFVQGKDEIVAAVGKLGEQVEISLVRKPQ